MTFESDGLGRTSRRGLQQTAVNVGSELQRDIRNGDTGNKPKQTSISLSIKRQGFPRGLGPRLRHSLPHFLRLLPVSGRKVGRQVEQGGSCTTYLGCHGANLMSKRPGRRRGSLSPEPVSASREFYFF